MPSTAIGLAISDEAIKASLLGFASSKKMRVQCLTWHEATSLPDTLSQKPQFVVGVLPRRNSPAENDSVRIERMVSRLQCWAGLLSEECEVATLVQYSGSGSETSTDQTHWECGSAAAFARSIHLESPRMRVRVLDFHPSICGEEMAMRVVESLESMEPFVAVSFDRDGKGKVPQVRPVTVEQWPVRPFCWSSDDVLLVTGGGKGITAECALAFARETGLRCALTGRSDAIQDHEVRDTLRRFKEAGLTAEWFKCDISKREQVAALADGIMRQMGPVSGILHGAGQNTPRRVREVSVSEAFDEIAPKVLGALHLCDLLPHETLKLVVGLTSSIGITGMGGNAWYAFSNELLHTLLGRWALEKHRGATQAIAFSLWADVGMGARLGVANHLAEIGIGAIPREEGTRRFVELCLRDPEASQVAVTGRMGRLPTWPTPSLSAAAGLRFLDNIVLFEAGVELLARTRLHPSSDDYLLDHNFQGSLLFPTVFGLEAMAQAATHLLNYPEIPIRCIKNLGLERPIVVDPTVGCEIEIHAVVRELKGGDAHVVDVSIRAGQTGFTKDHFNASIIFGRVSPAPHVEIPRPQTPLAINGSTDLYGEILFQGPQFQRIQEILELDCDHAVFRSFEVESGESKVPHKGARWILGDPFFRDILLQAGQLTIPEELCLPIGIDQLDFFAASSPTAGERIVFAPLKVREGSGYRAEIFATDLQGLVRERLSGYRLQILSTREDIPTVSDLVAPGVRDQKLLMQLFAAFNAYCGGTRMGVAYSSQLRLHELNLTDRRAREISVVQQAYRNYLGLPEEATCEIALQWEDKGRPILTTQNSGELGVSISHDDFGCLCVVGATNQGADLEPLKLRTIEDWRALLTERRMDLFNQLTHAGDSENEAGTRIWCALEAYRKAEGGAADSIDVVGRFAQFVLLRMSGNDSTESSLPITVVSCPVRFTLGPRRMMSWVHHSNALEPDAPPTGNEGESFLEDSAIGGIPDSSHAVSVAHDGPEGQPVQEMTFVVSFQDASSAARDVPAARYLSWMGRIRELVTSVNVPSLVPMIQSGQWGLVTNWGELDVMGVLTANDVVRLRFWTDAPEASSVVFTCEFQTLVVGQSPQRVALARQQATWVKIIGHGQVRPEAFPQELAAFIAQMGPRSGRQPRRSLPATCVFDNLTKCISGADAVRLEVPVVLAKDEVQTTFEYSNFVGNIYFANYFHWQHRLFDKFIHQMMKSERDVAFDQWLTLRSSVNYLREAMPFDLLAIEMSLVEIGCSHIVVRFEYFRVENGGERHKLSVGEQTVVRVVRNGNASPVATDLPPAFRTIYSALTIDDASGERLELKSESNCPENPTW